MGLWTLSCTIVVLRGDCRAGVASVMEGGVSITGCWPAASIMGGTLPGMLLQVRRECNHFVCLNCFGAVGFGAIMIAEASVILVRGGSTL
jgi:hypothetical protein